MARSGRQIAGRRVRAPAGYRASTRSPALDSDHILRPVVVGGLAARGLETEVERTAAYQPEPPAEAVLAPGLREREPGMRRRREAPAERRHRVAECCPGVALPQWEGQGSEAQLRGPWLMKDRGGLVVDGLASRAKGQAESLVVEAW